LLHNIPKLSLIGELVIPWFKGEALKFR